MFEKIDHIEILPGNLERSLKFYTEILGFKVRWRFEPENAPIEEIVFIELGGTQIELFSFKNPPAPPETGRVRVGPRRIGLLVEDMEKAIEYLKEKGVEISSGPRATRENLKIAEIKDPDGLAIELIER
jgi:catechol 2,3-dioxygenase-like lactoylglutathione lyase family enzyme